MWRRCAVLVLACTLASTLGSARAEPDAPIVIESQSRAEDQLILDEDQARIEGARREAAAAKAIEQRQAIMQEELAAAHAAARAYRRGRRRTAYALYGVGVAFIGATIVFAKLGNDQNDAVKDGGYQFPSEIIAAQKRGEIYNYSAWGALGLAGLFGAIGTGILLRNRDIGDLEVTPKVTSDVKGLAIGGSF